MLAAIGSESVALLIALGVVIGVAGGALLVWLTRHGTPKEREEREDRVAKAAARKAVDETISEIVHQR